MEFTTCILQFRTSIASACLICVHLCLGLCMLLRNDNWYNPSLTNFEEKPDAMFKGLKTLNLRLAMVEK